MNGDIVIYENREYNYFDFLHIVKNMKKATIYILNQNIYIRKVKINSNKIDDDEINNIKKLEFGDEEEYLIHYEINKKEKYLYMYALSGGRIILGISKYFKELKVIPIQMQYKRKFEKIIKQKNYQCLFSYLGIYYYFAVKNGYIELSNIYRDISYVMEFVKRLENPDILYIQKGIEIDKDNINIVEVGDIYNDKILFK